MVRSELIQLIRKPEYDFLRTENHLKGNILFLTVGGSHAYGTNIATSDVDIRGCAANRPQDLIGLSSFDQFCDDETDTTIYSFNKLVRLLMNCNPNVIELLGCKPEMYIEVKPSGQMLLDNKELFLSRKAIGSFGGYANDQLRRLNNMDVSSLGKRNKKAIDKGKVAKHMMHLVRLYLMAFDILEKGEINTYREKEHEFLMNIRKGEYLYSDMTPTPQFVSILDEYEKRLAYDKLNTELPERPDYNKIEELVMEVNREVVMGAR